jgi:3-ketosteroid 9alpha-monooxygenase subunit B
VTTTDDPATAVVHLDGQTHSVSWPRGEKLLDVLLDEGIEAPYSCREGHCGACATTLVSGEVEMETNDVLEPDDLEDGLILACQSRPKSDAVEVTYD